MKKLLDYKLLKIDLDNTKSKFNEGKLTSAELNAELKEIKYYHDLKQENIKLFKELYAICDKNQENINKQSLGDIAFKKLEGSLFRKSLITGNNQIEYTSLDLVKHYNAYKATFKNSQNFYGETKFLNLVKNLDYVETKRVCRVNPISGKKIRPTVYTGLELI